MPQCSKILKSAGKTINLAKPQVYQVPRKPPLNTLVFEKLPEPRCGDRIAIEKPLTPKPVRICTKEELQAMYCCPPPCDCKIKTRKTALEKIVNTLLLVGKTMIVGGLIYYTWAEGLWSDSEHSRCALVKTAAKLFFVQQLVKYTWKEGLWSDAFHSSCFLGKLFENCPEPKELPQNEYASSEDQNLPQREPCFPFIPRADYMAYKLGQFWNSVVISVFWVAVDGPYEFVQFIIDYFTPVPEVKVIEPCDEIRARKR